MTLSLSPQSVAKPRPRAEKVAAATALVTAFGDNAFVEPSLRSLCETYLTGDATFFGVPMFADGKALRAIQALIVGAGVDLDAMEAHYHTLIGE